MYTGFAGGASTRMSALEELESVCDSSASLVCGKLHAAAPTAGCLSLVWLLFVVHIPKRVVITIRIAIHTIRGGNPHNPAWHSIHVVVVIHIRVGAIPSLACQPAQGRCMHQRRSPHQKAHILPPPHGAEMGQQPPPNSSKNTLNVR